VSRAGEPERDRSGAEMLALDEKVRTVVLLRPELCYPVEERPQVEVPEGEAAEGAPPPAPTVRRLDQEIIAKFQENYLEVKAKKQVYLTQVDAEQFFHYLPAVERKAQVDAVTRGLSTVLVLQELDNQAIEKTIALAQELSETYGADSIYCSQSLWETVRDLEFFFPHLDSLPPERTLALIKADGLARGKLEGQTLEEVVENEVAAMGLFVVAKRRTNALRDVEAEVLCEELKGTPDYNGALGVLMAEPGAVALCLEGRGAIGKWLLLCGPGNAGVARDRAPMTLRAKWGTDGTSNAVHGSANMAAAENELKVYFSPGSLQVQRTLCIVKPDALHGLLQIQMEIESGGFTVLKAKQTQLTEDRAKEFYRDYKDKPQFACIVREAVAGPCCVLVLCRLEAVTVWQQMMGPESVKDAQSQRPNSLRARWGSDGQRNAVHGSASAKAAAREVSFFFPEMGADPIPDDGEVRDFLFRKSAGASMDLKSLDADSTDFTVDPTLQMLISRGLMALCQVQPKGLGAVKWLSRWLAENNPNTTSPDAKKKFQPPDRNKRFVEYGVNQDGLPFSVEAPPPAKKKTIIEVDVSAEAEENRVTDLTTPPFVVFIAGGPGSGKGTQCTKLKEDFNFVHLSTGDLMRDEVAAETYLGTEIYKHMQAGTLVPDTVTMQLLKKTMVKHQDTNRFLLDGFPRSLEQAKRFEHEVGELAFVLYFEAEQETMKQRIAERAVKAPGRVDDNPKTVEKRLKIFQEQTLPVIDYYGPIGKVRKVNAEKDMDEVYAEAKQFFSCRFLYLIGPPGAPASKVAECVQKQYSYSSINFKALLQDYANSDEKDASKVKQALLKGKPVEASIACPLVLAEIFRDMALGVQNFVISDFPQSLKQVEFLEYRVPCSSRPVLLDFTRADAEDLVASTGDGRELFEMEMKMEAFFAPEMQDAMLKKLKGLVRIPCSLAGLDTVEPADASAAGVEGQLVEAAWASVKQKIMPSVTVVLGLPHSGTSVLAPMLAGAQPNTQAVDCAQLLDKEMDRKTEVGLAMHNMLAKGQVVPLSMTLQLLKGVVNLTCSDALVLEGCPMYADEIPAIAEEFRIDRVFHIAGNEAAELNWREEYIKSAGGDSAKAKAAFMERADRLEAIVQHFSRLGRLERFEVTKTPEREKLRKMIEQATTPQFAVVTGLSSKHVPEQAASLAAAYGLERALTQEFVVEWAKNTLKRTVDPAQPEQFFSALLKYADVTGASLLVLDRYPSTADEAAQFLAKFDPPKVVVKLSLDEEKFTEEFEEAHAEDDPPIDSETIPEIFAERNGALEGTIKVFEEKCPACLVPLDAGATVQQATDTVKARLLPQVYVIVAPSGVKDFSGLLVDAICTTRTEGGQLRKYTAIDSVSLSRRGGHSPSIEDRLLKASFQAEAPDALAPKLWTELFQEAFSNATNPMGTFLVTNFPTPCSMYSSPTIRDQFCMLQDISVFMGILLVKLSDGVFRQLVSEEPADLERHRSFQEAVQEQVAQQFGSSQICEVLLEDEKKAREAPRKAADAFLRFQEGAET